MMPKSTIIALVVFSAIALFFHAYYPNISDPDSFYHIRHASLYRENGILNSNFPWVTKSAIGKFGADIWYGFHILLIPFTYGDNLIRNIKI